MGRDSSGTYTRTQSNYSFNTVISETQINSELNDIASELTLSLEASGKKAWTGNQNCGSQKMTALAAGSALTDSTNLGQVQNGATQYAAGSGTNTIVATMAPAIAAYAAGQTFRIKMAAGANTGATTLNLNSVGARAITKRGTTALAAGDIPANMMFEVAYDGTQFQLINVGLDAGMTAIVSDTSPQLGGDLDCNGAQIQWSKGSDVASATALPLLTDGNYFDVTGTATITSFNATGGAGTQVKLHFDGACTLTNNSDLILPGGANIVTAAGDEADFIEFAAGDYRCTSYTKASGLAVIRPAASATAAGIVELATDAETETGTDAVRATTPAGVASIVGSVLQAYDADTLKADTADVLTAGYACTVHNAGTKASGTYTPDEADGNMQKFVNGGAHTLAPPANDCTLVLQQTNNASAGTITTSGFTLVDGDDFTTTNGHDFFLYITNSDAFSLLTVKALQ